ncbi:glycosyltransferase family A protein [Chryseobacterium foetidum]|uniref:glycosyltransferase family A protein n=1 Tax=Chryseobacterium foetidum TaxID=2951057 RepID=UPI0021CA078C|nr:glycosyltransferase family A protein [Chryseobacterium foetidum]
MKRKLAIVIPYYKIDFFEETLKSVARQSDKNFVLYIGNDASPHNPLPLITKYFSSDQFIYFEYKDNLGSKNLALQWERILDNVKEEWFQILGDDDMIANNFVDEFYKSLPVLEKENITAFKTTHDWIDKNNNLLESFNYKEYFLESVHFIMKKYSGEVKSSLSENIFTTKMWRKFRFQQLPLAWGSDDLALLQFSGYKRIFYNMNTKVSVRISTSSISGSSKFDRDKEFAIQIFREKIILENTSIFPSIFINEITDQYLYKAHIENFPVKYLIAFQVLKRNGIIAFLKTLRKIFYIKKIHNN